MPEQPNQNPQGYPSQQTQQYRQPAQPQQYRQPAQPQYRQPVQQYQQPQYPQQQYQQPAAPAPPPEQKSSLGRLVVLLVFFGIIATFFFVGKSMFFPEEAQLPEEIAQVIEAPVITGLPVGDTNFIYNGYVNDLDTLLVHNENYDAGEEVLVYTLVDNFEQPAASPEVSVKLKYGITLYDDKGNGLEDLSNDELYIVDEKFDEEVENYFFTASIPTNNLITGTYTVEISIIDENAGTENKQTLELVLDYPSHLALTGPFLGILNPRDLSFDPKETPNRVGDVIQTFMQIRGFKVDGTRPNVHVSLYITDAEGDLIPGQIFNDFFVANNLYSEAPVILTVNADIPTKDLAPGTYNIEYVIKDELADRSTIGKVEMVLI